MKNRLLGLATSALIVTAAATASAQQEPLPLNRYNPAWAGDHFFGVASPFAAGHLEFHGMVIGDYAHNPLVIRRVLPDGDEAVGSVVEHQLFLHLNATFSLWNRLAINVDAPIALFQDGDAPTAGNASFMSPSGAEIGDIRVGLRGRIYGEYEDPFQIGVGAVLWLPSGSSDPGSYVGNGSVRGMPSVLVGGMVERFIYSAELGTEIGKSQAILDAGQGTMLRWGLGAGVLLGDERTVQVGVEASGGLVFEDVQQRTTNAEVLAGAKWRFVDDFVVGGAVGPGLSSGVGTPDVRALVTLAYSPNQLAKKGDRDRDGILDQQDACPDVPGPANVDPDKHGCPPPPDRDQDGILDKDDACIDVPGVAQTDPLKNGCPLPGDADGDGILDNVDACPRVVGVASSDPTQHGCPRPDTDGDGIFDDVDACPKVAGVASSDPAKNGCPPPADSDGDGILDKDDACPAKPGVANADPKKHGCPKVVVTDSQILILERVEFDTDKATIRAVSDDILDQVAKVLKEHPEITKLEVQGHTDDRGGKFHNKQLSQRRAQAVVNALVGRGIEKARLTAKGFGQESPIASNDTDEGRQDNRRVQFEILEKRK